jgi:hypothetical protein
VKGDQLEVRCSQCGTLWAVNPQQVDPDVPYQCNACGFVFTVNPEGVPPMQIRHTNGKVYNVKDLETLIRWVEQKRIPRQCLVRSEGGEWSPVMEVPEVAARFAERDARRAAAKRPGDEASEVEEAVTTTPRDDDLEALARAAEAMVSPGDSSPASGAAEEELASPNFDPFEVAPSPTDADDPSATEEALGTDQAADSDLLGDAGNADIDAPKLVELEAALDQLDGVGTAEELTEEPGEDGLDEDSFFADQRSEVFDDDVVLAAQVGATDYSDALDDDPVPKRSKLPLVVGLAALAGGGYYFLAGGAAGPVLDASAKSGAGAEVAKRLNQAFTALGSDSIKAKTNALNQLTPMLCERQKAAACAKLPHCSLDPEKGTCKVDPNAASYATIYYLADRLWRETARPDSTVQGQVAAVAGVLTKDQESTAGRARVGALTSLWAPAESGPAPIWRDIGDKLLSKGAQVPNAQLLVALQAIDAEQANEAKKLFTAANGGADKPNDTLRLISAARLARAQVRDGDCGPAADAYAAAKAKGLNFATKEFAAFLAVGGDLGSGRTFIGEAAAGDPLLTGILRAAALGAPMNDAALKKRFAKINKVNLRKHKKAFRYIIKALSREKEPTAKRGDLLSGIAEIIPSALSEASEGAWIALSLAQDSEDAALKKSEAEKALKRFGTILTTDPNRRDALLGRAGAAILLGDSSHRSDFFAWLFSAPATARQACVQAAKK